MTLSDPKPPQTIPFSVFCTAIHSFATDEPRDFKFGTLICHSKSHPANEKSSLKGAWSGSVDPFLNFTPHVITPQRLTLETSNRVMVECTTAHVSYTSDHLNPVTS